MLEKYLQEIGLSDKEAAIYLSLLQVDNSSVIDLANKTKIKRPTVYVILESLAKKGLVSETTIGKKTHYQAEAPERLETFLERQKVVLEEHTKRLKDMIPQIKSIQRESGERPVVKYFEGREGIITGIEELFQDEEGGDITYLIYPNDLLDGLFTKEERQKYKNIRLTKKIKSKVLYTSTEVISSDTMGDRLRIDGSKYPISCDISIYKDKVRINILGDKLSGIFIRSKDFADTMRSLFSLIYDTQKGNQ